MNQNQLDAMYIIERFISQHVGDPNQRRELFDAVTGFLQQPEIVNELNEQRLMEVQS
jgi:hypothetical protein